MFTDSRRALLFGMLLLGCDAAGPSVDGSIVPDAPALDSAMPLLDSGARLDAPRGDAGPLVAGVWRDITPAGIDPAAHACTDLQYDPSTPTTLYAMFGDGGGIQRSTDGGTSWVQIGNLPMPNSLGRLRIDPGDPSHLYATGSVQGASLGFWVSHDAGETWRMPAAFMAGAAASSWTLDVYNIAVDPTDFDHFILTFHGGWGCCGDDAGIVESQDGGVTFIRHAPPAGMNHGQGVAFLYDLASGQGDSRTWLVGGGYGPGYMRTTDGGDNWSPVAATYQDNHGGFDLHYSAQGFLYTGVDGGILRSTDNGVTWQMASDGVPYDWYYGVIGDGRFFYSCGSFVGRTQTMPFLVSPEGGADEGLHWSVYSDQILPDGPWRMVFEPSHRIVYNAAWNGGAWALSVGP